ncbi:DUF3055 domain-containing protein [Caldalkalibacillus salinus]|uniref:DUF3055 domain-containing protein n=1 Tax=Caldalkalibacillus salinus TaxID=2803787 RepID=UPI001921B965|nr:DUF3055 domain-containing protein [Caldalkalibacillus salinus]
MSDAMFMYDDTEDTQTRFVGFIGETKRFDLALTSSQRFFGKLLVHDIQTGRSAIIGDDDLKEEGYLEHVYQLSEEEAQELHAFLEQVVTG